MDEQLRLRELARDRGAVEPDEGSFQRNRNGSYTFEGALGGVPVDARLAPQGGGWSFQLETRGPLTGLAGAVTVGLTIGNDTGTAPAAVSDGDD